MTRSNIINNICKAASFHIYSISRLRKYLTNDATQTLVHFIVTLFFYKVVFYKNIEAEIWKILRIF